MKIFYTYLTIRRKDKVERYSIGLSILEITVKSTTVCKVVKILIKE